MVYRLTLGQYMLAHSVFPRTFPFLRRDADGLRRTFFPFCHIDANGNRYIVDGPRYGV